MEYLRRTDGVIYPYTRALDARADMARCTKEGKLLEPYIEKPLDDEKVGDVPKDDSAKVRELEAKIARLEAIASKAPAPVETEPEPEVASEDAALLADLPSDKDALVAMAMEQYSIPLDKRMSVANMKRQIVESMKSTAPDL